MKTSLNSHVPSLLDKDGKSPFPIPSTWPAVSCSDRDLPTYTRVKIIWFKVEDNLWIAVVHEVLVRNRDVQHVSAGLALESRICIIITERLQNFLCA